MLESLLLFFVVGVIGVLVIGVALALIGLFFNVALGLAGFLLFKVLPIVLLGWLIVRFLAPRRSKRDPIG